MAGRRAKGTGKVTFLKSSNRWQGVFNGKTYYAKTRKECTALVDTAVNEYRQWMEEDKKYREEWAKKYPNLNYNYGLAKKLLHGETLRPTKIKDAMYQWLLNEKTKDKPSTYLRKEQTVFCNIFPLLAMKYCHEVTIQDVNAVILRGIHHELSLSSIKKIENALIPFFKWACAHEQLYAEYNIFNGYERITETKYNNLRKSAGLEATYADKRVSENQFFTPEERIRFVEACRASYSTGTPCYEHGEALVLMLYTGVRIGELLALRWEDVDLDKRKVRIANNLTEKQVNPYTKTKSGQREIPLGKEAYTAVMNLLAKKKPDDEFLVMTKQGEHVDQKTIIATFHRIIKRAGIELAPGTATHALRHSFASMLYETKGISVKEIQKLMGHANYNFTMDTYVHLTEDVSLESIPALEDLK